MTDLNLSYHLDRIQYAQTLGVKPLMMGKEFTLILPYTPENIGNPFIPALHGGVIGGFLELAAICQIMISGNYTKLPKPIGVNVDYLRAGQPRDCYARTEIAKKGNRVVNVRTRAWQDSLDVPIAVMHGHFLIDQDGAG